MSGDGKRFDPGWNDPPTLNYSFANPPPKSRIGNKRVAFPLSSSSPTQTINTGKTVTNESNQQLPEDLEPWDSLDVLKEVMDNINLVLRKKENTSETIKEKVALMKVMWEENKFNRKLQKIILNMTKCIVDENKLKANEYHLQLMMENSTLCNPWIVGFRQLIND